MRLMNSLLAFLFILSACSSKEKNNEVKNHPDTSRVIYTSAEFVMGADLSYVNQILDHGGVYKDSGKIEDPYRIFRQHGANVIRFRLFHTPAWTKDVYGQMGTQMYNDFADVKKGIEMAKSAGLKVCLDFHYSDSWADPSKQVIPKAWESVNLDVLRDSVYNYTYKTLNTLGLAGLMPDYVQTGNEINPGFLLPVGDRWEKKNDFILLLNGAIKAVRDVSATSSVKPEIILHIAQPENASPWFEGMAAAGLTDYDIAGLSYYYMWSTVPIDDLSNYVGQIKTLTGKDVMVVETCYPWTVENNDTYSNIINTNKINGSPYPATTSGQLNYLVKLTQEIIDGGGKGIIYWEPAWITSDMKDMWGTGSSWDCNTLFDFSGNVNRGMRFITWKYLKR